MPSCPQRRHGRRGPTSPGGFESGGQPPRGPHRAGRTARRFARLAGPGERQHREGPDLVARTARARPRIADGRARSTIAARAARGCVTFVNPQDASVTHPLAADDRFAHRDLVARIERARSRVTGLHSRSTITAHVAPGGDLRLRPMGEEKEVTPLDRAIDSIIRARETNPPPYRAVPRSRHATRTRLLTAQFPDPGTPHEPASLPRSSPIPAREPNPPRVPRSPRSRHATRTRLARPRSPRSRHATRTRLARPRSSRSRRAPPSASA